MEAAGGYLNGKKTKNIRQSEINFLSLVSVLVQIFCDISGNFEVSKVRKM